MFTTVLPFRALGKVAPKKPLLALRHIVDDVLNQTKRFFLLARKGMDYVDNEDCRLRRARKCWLRGFGACSKVLAMAVVSFPL